MADRLDIERADREIELRRLDLRFAAARVSDERAVRRLMQSIDACGQLVACYRRNVWDTAEHAIHQVHVRSLSTGLQILHRQ